MLSEQVWRTTWGVCLREQVELIAGDCFMANKVKILGKEYDEQEVANQLGAYDKLHGAYTKGQQELANLNDLKSFRDQLEAHPKLRAEIDGVTQEYVGDAGGVGVKARFRLPNT